MPKTCCVPFCTSNNKKNPGLRFSMFPTMNRDQPRRDLWLQTIRGVSEKQKRWNPENKFLYVCGLHFITGFHVNDKDHPDYVPSIFPSQAHMEGANIRKRESFVTPTSTKRICLTPSFSNEPIPQAEVQPTTSQASQDPTFDFSIIREDAPIDENIAVAIEVASLREERDAALRERDEARRQLDVAELKWSKERLFARAVQDSRVCKDLTGLKWPTFDCLHKFLTQFTNSKMTSQQLTTEDQLFLCLLKFRQNTPFVLLGQMMDLHPDTLSRCFHDWLDLLFAKITFLIHWPDRDCILQTIPPLMKDTFPRLTSIIDCFEIQMEYPKPLKARKWTTVKYFISCSPAGSITFLSKGWNGRTSDVEIVRESGFISSVYHHPGDQILAGRNFTLKDDFASLGASLEIPDFTRGGKQLPEKEDEESRVKSNVRMHIERVVGLLKRRFHILDGPLQVSFIKSQGDEMEDEDVATIDKIVHVCAALVNMSESVVFKN
ncbi:hypothetical protein WMY93_002141 [Mugilogobius chulae]|uniref:THAP-type domain-containing protein n=1 Tax=Mugilogobius chulae TaxID=88201 RepID=A0AAW0PTJ8_9GOBI